MNVCQTESRELKRDIRVDDELDIWDSGPSNPSVSTDEQDNQWDPESTVGYGSPPQ